MKKKYFMAFMICASLLMGCGQSDVKDTDVVENLAETDENMEDVVEAGANIRWRKFYF